MSVVGVMHQGLARVAWFVKGVLGEDAYEKYREHYAATHPDADAARPRLMTEREFWRDRTDRQEAHPEGRCC
jgi:uncharacterized short protein YbdD (DUF466 family)